MTTEERAREIKRQLNVTYGMALMLAMSERDEFEGDMFIIDDDGNERPAPLTPMEEPANGINNDNGNG